MFHVRFASYLINDELVFHTLVFGILQGRQFDTLRYGSSIGRCGRFDEGQNKGVSNIGSNGCFRIKLDRFIVDFAYSARECEDIRQIIFCSLVKVRYVASYIKGLDDDIGCYVKEAQRERYDIGIFHIGFEVGDRD